MHRGTVLQSRRVRVIGPVSARGTAMERAGWHLVAAGLLAFVVCTVMYVIFYAFYALESGRYNRIADFGPFIGLVVASIGASLVCKARFGRWPPGF